MQNMWNIEYGIYYISDSIVFMFDMLYHIYQNMEYVGSDERVGSHVKGQLRSSTHQVFLCALGSPKPTFLGGTAYPTTHTQYSVCIIPYANMPDFGQRAPCQIHL